MFEQFLATTALTSSRLRISSERGLGDSFALLFAAHYLSHALQSGERRWLVDAIVALELALLHYSPHNFQFKLWLIRLYCHPLIGGVQRAGGLYKSLDLKQIQHDITSHLILDDWLRYGHVTQGAHELCARVENWHRAADREEVATTELAYTRASYTKVGEFVEFKERRQRSLARYTAAVMGAHCGLHKLGIGPDQPTASHATAPVAQTTDSKDITHVHAYLKRSAHTPHASTMISVSCFCAFDRHTDDTTWLLTRVSEYTLKRTPFWLSCPVFLLLRQFRALDTAYPAHVCMSVCGVCVCLQRAC